MLTKDQQPIVCCLQSSANLFMLSRMTAILLFPSILGLSKNSENCRCSLESYTVPSWLPSGLARNTSECRAVRIGIGGKGGSEWVR